MNKKKQHKLQAIPGNGKGQAAPSVNIMITVNQGRVQIAGFPNNLDTALDILHEARRAVEKFFIEQIVKQVTQEQPEPKPREFMGARPN